MIITTRALLATGLTLLACAPATAQAPLQPTRPERPYRGIFASGVDNSGQSLTGTATFSGGYDDNLLADATQRNTFSSGQGGGLGQFSGGLNYAWNKDRGSVNAGLGTSLRYYPALEEEYFKTYNASIGGVLQVLRKPNVTVHSSASYQPYSFLSSVFSPQDAIAVGASSVPEPDFVVLATQYVTAGGGAELSHQLSRKVTFTTSYDYLVTDRQSNGFWRQDGGASFVVGMTRDLGLRLGYRYTEAHYDDRLVATHRPDIGLDFLRALSLTRRTSLTFSVGTEATAIRGTTRFRATGDAKVTHEIGRSWTAAGSYQRGTYFAETLSEPVFGDSGSLTLAGLLTRRWQLQASAHALVGEMGFGSGRKMDQYRGSVTLSTALNRFMNIGVDYAYYRYLFDSAVELEPGVPHEINRQSIRAHLSLWAPLMNRSRTANASR